MVISKDAPSIYTSIPSIPSVQSIFDPQNSTVKESDSLFSISRLIQQGPASCILQDLIQQEIGKAEEYGKYREWYERSRKKKRTERGWTSAEAGDDERGKSTQVEESGGEEGARKRGRPRKEVAKEKRDQFTLPKLYREIGSKHDLPENFPSESLLASLHSHSSQLFTSTHSLLPPLTSTTPLLPPHLLTHFSNLQESLHKEEEALFKSLKRKGQQQEVKKGRIARLGGGTRKGAWTNAEKAFDSSALVAMGMLTQLLVEDALTSEHVSTQAQDQDQTRPAAMEGEESDPNLALPVPPVVSTSSSRA